MWWKRERERERETVQLPLTHSFHAALQVDGQCYVPTIELNMFYPVDVEYRSRTLLKYSNNFKLHPVDASSFLRLLTICHVIPVAFPAISVGWPGGYFLSMLSILPYPLVNVYITMEITIFYRKTHYKWPFSIAIVSHYQRVVYIYPHYWIQITLAIGCLGPQRCGRGFHGNQPRKGHPGPLKDARSEPLATSTRKQLLPSSKSITVRGL